MPYADQSGKDGYERLKTDIPTEQPMRFILGYAKAGYLPHEDTDDESTHYRPQQVVDQITRRRVMQTAIIRLGDASSFSYHLYFIEGATGLPADLSVGKMFSFNGSDAKGHWIRDDNGFDTTHANIGEIVWTPLEEVANTPGFYKTAQFLIESEDRTQKYVTLEFSFLVINNDVARPRELNWHLDEYLRLMYHLFEMQDNADEQISYLLKYADNAVDTNLKAQAKKVAAQQQIDQIIADFQTKINEFSQKIIDFEQKIKSLDQATTDLISKEKQFETTLAAKEQQLETNITNKEQQLEDQLKAQEQAFETDLTQKYTALKQQQDTIAKQIADNNIVTAADLKQEVAKQVALISAQEDVQGADLQEFLDNEGGPVNVTPAPPDDNDNSGSDSADSQPVAADDLLDSKLRAFLNQENNGYQDSGVGPEGDVSDLGTDDIANDRLKEFVINEGGNY